MPVLVDTGVLLAIADRRDAWHQRALAFVAKEPRPFLVPATVLAEAAYLLNRNLGPQAEIAAIDSFLTGAFRLEPLTDGDLRRVRELLLRYHDLRLGLVDASVIAVAERLGITRIATVDRRDFSLVQPAHCKRFELLP